jgi:GAF domain-containing protein
MSKKSDKKRLRAQLDNLFVDLEQDIELEVQSLESDINAPGWVWECDADGIYTTCSPEVQDFLGIESQKFIGQKVATFKVAPSSQEQIQKALENGAQAQETSAHFLTNKNTQIKVALQILPQEMENGTEAGWRGFAQPIGKFEDQQIVIPENPSETATAGTLQGDLFNKGEIAPPDVNPYTYAISQSLQTGELSLSSGDSKPSVLTAPFRADQDELGLLQILDDDPDRQWSDDERLLVKQVVDQVALALENAQLFQQTQAALKETDVLYQASADLNAAQNYEDVIEVLRKYTIMGENSGMIAVNLFDHPWTETYTPKWFDTLHRWAETPAGQLSQRFQLTNYSPTGEILRREAVMIENMLGAQPNLAAHLRQLYNTGFNIRSAITIPIIIGNQWLGFIEALYRVPTTIPNEELLRLDTLVIQATEKILGFQLNQRIESRRENADRLAKIARRMTEMTNEVELRRYLVQEIFDHINPTSIALLEWSKLENAFRVDLHISAPLEDQINKIQAGDLVMYSTINNRILKLPAGQKKPSINITCFHGFQEIRSRA